MAEAVREKRSSKQQKIKKKKPKESERVFTEDEISKDGSFPQETGESAEGKVSADLSENDEKLPVQGLKDSAIHDTGQNIADQPSDVHKDSPMLADNADHLTQAGESTLTNESQVVDNVGSSSTEEEKAISEDNSKTGDQLLVVENIVPKMEPSEENLSQHDTCRQEQVVATEQKTPSHQDQTQSSEESPSQPDQSESFYSAVSSLSDKDVYMSSSQVNIENPDSQTVIDNKSETDIGGLAKNLQDIKIKDGGIYPHLSFKYLSDVEAKTDLQDFNIQPIETEDTSVKEQNQKEGPITEVVISVGPTEENKPKESSPSAPETSQPDTDTVSAVADTASTIRSDEQSRVKSRETPQIQERKFQPLTLEQLQSLYYNQELINNASYIDNFVQYEKKKDNHPFLEILNSYLRARRNLIHAEEEVKALQNNYSQSQDEVWITAKHSVNAKGPCGDGYMCKSTHLFEVCEFSDDTFRITKRALDDIRHALQNQLALHSYSTQLARLQVESYIHNLFMTCPVLRDLPRNAPVHVCDRHSPNEEHQISRLRDCIAVLFTFHRKPINDEEFIKHLKDWTIRLVSALVRVACYTDHLFILNHILRCPAGVGTWSTGVLQMPHMINDPSQMASFGSPVLDHMMTSLATILMPIKARESFVCLMKEVITPDPQHGNTWILVDSDGEEDEDPKNAWMYLLENDLVAILNQIPIAEVFKHILLIGELPDGQLDYDVRRTSDSMMIKLFAFCTCLLNLLGWGLHTYNMVRYRQLNKRLGRTIRQVVQYMSDHWENFQAQNRNMLPEELLQRLQLEYSQFFLRATSCILTAERLGCWQFMTDMPYSTISKEMTWQLLWLYHQGKGQSLNVELLPPVDDCVKFIKDPDSRQQLCDTIQQLPMSESIYLLTALANMAQSRRADEADLIQAICLSLFEVCYVCVQTRETCSKVGRELLAATATVHPYILSLLIHGTKDNMDNLGSMALYLFKELPFDHWLPRDQDIEILRSWLLDSDLSDSRHLVARLVLNKINWDVNHETRSLYVPCDVHKNVAILLTEAYGKFVVNKNLGFWFLEGMKQVASAVKQQQTSEQLFNNWAWEVAIKLHLHQSSFPKADHGLAEASGGPPDLANDNSFLPVTKGIKERNPMASYVAVMATKLGHSNGLFLTEGLDLLVNLADNSHYRPTLHVLNCVTDLFCASPQALAENDKFMRIIQSLLTADDSFLKVTKLWSQDFPGPMTKLFSCMIQDCIQTASDLHNMSIVLKIITLWIKILIKPSHWYQDRNSCYLVDGLIRAAFTQKIGLDSIKIAFEETFLEHYKESQQQGAVSTFVNWVSSGSSCTMIPSLIEKICTPESFAWLAFLILDIDYKFEEQTNLWTTFKEEIQSDTKHNPEQALKKATTKLKLEFAPGLHSLNIYRWARQVLDTPIGHPVLPLLWQRFFSLFLGRMVSQLSMQQRASVGEKMFEVTKHTGELKKMKKRLKETADYQLNLISEIQKADVENSQSVLGQEPEESTNHIEKLDYIPSKEFHQELARFYQTFQLWTEEPMLHDAKLYLPALPAQYQSDRLLKLFQNQIDPWLETVDMDRVVYELAQMTSEWQTSLLGEEHKQFNLSPSMMTMSAKERILNRLKRHEQPKELPSLQPLRALVPEISVNVMQDKAAIMHVFRSDLQTLKEFAKSFHSRTSQHVACDDDFVKLLPMLYYNQPRQVQVTIECKSTINPLHKCSNPAVVNVSIKEKSTDEVVRRQIDENRAEFKQLLIEGINPPPQHVCVSAVHIENAITMLVKLSRSCTDDAMLAHYKDTACTLFFHLAESFNHDIQFYPPTKQFFSACMDLLGNEFLQQDPTQPESVLQFALENPEMAGHMSPHFVPLNCPHRYLNMYERLVQVLQDKNPELVFTLLTKYDIEEWLMKVKPSQMEIKRFTDIMGTALYSCGSDPDTSHSLVFEVYCSHLQHILHYKFPVNLQLILNVLLQGMSEQKIHVKCWKMFHGECFVTEQASEKLQEISPESSVSSVLSNEMLKDLLQCLGTFFHQLRLSSAELSTFGLYPNLHQYIPYLVVFIKDTVVCLVRKISQTLPDINPGQALDMIWQTTVHAFLPWIQAIPTQTTNLFPWIQADLEVAKEMMESFSSAVSEIYNNFKYVLAPYQPDVLTLLWHYYAQILCFKNTPAHVTVVYSEVLKQLPWDQLKPDFRVLESMVQLKDTNCTESFELLAHIVCELDWTEILQYYSQSYPGDGHSRALATVLILLIQCFGDQKHIEIPALTQKMQTAEMYDWTPLTSESLRHAANWLMQTCDPTCVLVERSSSAVLGIRLLKAASGFNVKSSAKWSSELSSKRQCYVHCVIQLFCRCTYTPGVNVNSMSMAILNLMTEIETVCSTVVDQRMQQDETLDLVKEILGLLNNCNPENESLDQVMKTVVEWLQSSPRSILLLPCMKAASRCLASHKQIVCIIEECICVYFKGGMDQVTGGGWDQVLGAIQIPDLNTEDFLTTALQEGSYLLLYGYTVLQQPLCQGRKQGQDLIRTLLTWISSAKPSSENESKMVMLFFKLLELTLTQIDCGVEQKVVIPMLKSLVSSLHQLGEDRASTGLLGAIGFGKRSTLTHKFRVFARALSAMVSTQIKDDSNLRLEPGSPTSNTSQARSERGALQSMRTNKQYQQYNSQVQIATDFVLNDRCCFRDTLDLIHNLCVAFYPEKEYLSIVHHYR